VFILVGGGDAVAVADGQRCHAATSTTTHHNDRFMAHHLIDARVLLGLAMVGAGNTLGFGRRWTNSILVHLTPGSQVRDLPTYQLLGASLTSFDCVPYENGV
jgi:hypothetical protein